jgi:hypothetical protein
MIENIFKTLLNIGHIIYYKIHMVWLNLIDVQIPIPNHFNPMTTPSQIDQNDDLVNDYIDSWDGDDVAKMLGHMDEDGSYIKEPKHKPYDGPYCETP